MTVSMAGRGAVGTAVLVVGALIGSVLIGSSASAADAPVLTLQERRAHAQELWPEGDDDASLLASSPASQDSSTARDESPGNAAVDVQWPSSGTARIAVASVPTRESSQTKPARSDDESAAAAPAMVKVIAASTAGRAKVRGLLLQVARTKAGTATQPLQMSVDYSGFKGAFGGGWGTRLRLVALPACSLTSPDVAACQTQTPIESVNDASTQTVTAKAAALSTGVVALTAASAGPSGDWSATSLAASSAWAVSTQTGAFTWSYPMRVPPADSGLEPELALSYSSASVDGRVAATNNQSSWVGDGWDLWSGFVERKYVPCSEDTDGDANNDGHKTGDLCWSTDNATLVFNGSSTELVRDEATGVWRPKMDDGTRVERRTGAFDAPDNTDGAWNDDNNNEYWIVTTPDGVKYYFGRGKTTNAGSALNSAWTVPVFGNNPGEPCHAAAFADSWCQQAWRWNLDYVVDPLGNAMTYRYGVETNNYGRNNNDAVSNYDRGGYLTRIDYGQRSGSETDPAPQQVVFTTAERCVASGAITCAASELNDDTASSWPDVPYDLVCTSSTSCPDAQSPAFFTRKRLATIETKTTIKASLQSVDSWTLAHTLPDPGDGTDAVLWLASIQHRGLVGTAITLPKVSFGGTQLENRVDKVGDVGAPMIRYRLSSITSESGGKTAVHYTEQDCSPTSLPASPQTNTRRCFPVQWTPEGRTEPITEYFHKYLVESVVSDPIDNANGSLSVETWYDYIGDAAWHYDDNDLLPAKRRTWSEFRGYATVDVRTGNMSATQSKVRYRYFGGMDGDHLPSGTRDVTVDDIADYDEYAGMLREQINYNGSAEVAGVVNTPWRSTPTATAADGKKAYHTGTATVRQRTTVADGDPRNTTVSTTFDDTYGTATQVDDFGDTSTDDDNRCTRYEYARNLGKNITQLVSRAETVSVRCSQDPVRPDDVISDTRTYYDGATAFTGQPISAGLPTKIEQIKSYSGSLPTYVGATTSYDALGRPTQITDALGRTTTTTYTAGTSALLPTVKVTTPPLPLPTGAQVTTSQIHPAWGVTASSTDVAGRVTTATFDGLGRTTQVWLPGRAQATATPSTKYGYTVGDAVGSTIQNAITTQTINAAGDGYKVSVQLYDALLRPRQTQTLGANRTTGGRVVTDTIYDSRGLVAEEYGSWATTGAPSTALVVPDVAVPARTRHIYDSAGRETATIFDVAEHERWRTTTTYGGDRTKVTPPSGGVPQTTVNDARGNTIQLIEDAGTTPASTLTTTYSHDPAGRLTGMVDPAGNQWSNSYDLLGRQTSSTDPDKGTSTSSYDDAGQLTSTKDANNKTLTYTYDNLGRKTQLSEGSTKLATWVYDTVAKGQLTSSSRWTGTTSSPNEYKTTIGAYDPQGRPLSQLVTIPTVEAGLAGTYTTNYTYTADGQVRTMGYAKLTATSGTTTGTPLPAETVVTNYDALSVPQTMTGGTGWGAYVAESTYSSYGEPLMLDLGPADAQMVNYSYEDGTRRLQRQWLFRQNVTTGYAMDTTYTYDDAGNLTSAIDVAPTAKDAQCFSYDGLRRLTQAWTPDPNIASCATAPTTARLGGSAPYWKNYTYDAVGNRTKEVAHTSAGDKSTTYTRVDPVLGTRAHGVTKTVTTGTSSATSSYVYDKAGNMTARNRAGQNQTLTWNSEGELATAADSSGTGKYTYSADGDRLIRDQAGVKTLYLPGQELTFKSGTTPTWTANRYYTFAGKTIGSRTTTSGSTSLSLISDAQGTASIAVASTTGALTQRRFDPFANPRSGSPTAWQGDHGFLDKPTDTTGLTQVGARYYDAAIGSFVSVDPMLDLSDPQQWNGYAYSNNNPTTWSDPTGMIYEGSQAMTNESEKVLSQHRKQTAAAQPRPVARVAPPVVKPLTGIEKFSHDWLEDSNGESIVANSLQSYGAGAVDSVLGLFDLITPGHIGRIGNPNKDSIYGYSDDIGNIIGPQILAGGPELGSLAKGGEALSAALREADEGIALFRHVDAAELGSIERLGKFAEGGNSMPGKFFADSMKDATEWGAKLNGGKGIVVSTRVPRSFADTMMRFEKLDGIGPARYTDDLPGLNGAMDGITIHR